MNQLEFLKAVYGDTEGLWFASFDERGIKSGYQGPDVEQLAKDRNNYVTVSKGDWAVEEDGKLHRRKDYFTSFHVLLVDDVGTKLDPQYVIDQVTLTPTFEMETSAGNETWGWVLDPPIEDPEVAWALVTRVSELFTADVKDIVKYYRLPGANTKYEGGRARLKTFNDVYYSAAELQEAFGAEERLPLDGGTRAPNVANENDPVLLALEEAGILGSKRGKAKWEITCPWQSEHTDEDPTGAAYLQPQGFKCHHNSCANRGHADLSHWLRAEGYLDYGVTDLAEYSRVKLRVGRIRRRGSWVGRGVLQDVIDAGAIAKPPKLEMLFKGVLPKEVVGIFAGPGGVGKSRLVMQMCVALASGQDFGPFQPVAPSRVLMLNIEDDYNETWRRFYRLQQRHPQIDWDLVKENLVVPGACAEMVLDDEGRLIEAIRRSGPFALVTLDPMGRLYPGIELQTAINTQEAATWIHNQLGTMSRELGAAVVGVHHVTKVGRSGVQQMSVSDITGSGQLTDFARWVMQMRTMSPEDQRKRFGLRDRKLLVEVQVTKSNYVRQQVTPWTLELGPRGILRTYEGERAKTKEEVFLEDLVELVELPASRVDIEENMLNRPSKSGRRYTKSAVKNLLVGAQEIGLEMIGEPGSKTVAYRLNVKVWRDP